MTDLKLNPECGNWVNALADRAGRTIDEQLAEMVTWYWLDKVDQEDAEKLPSFPSAGNVTLDWSLCITGGPPETFGIEGQTKGFVETARRIVCGLLRSDRDVHQLLLIDGRMRIRGNIFISIRPDCDFVNPGNGNPRTYTNYEIGGGMFLKTTIDAPTKSKVLVRIFKHLGLPLEFIHLKAD